MVRHRQKNGGALAPLHLRRFIIICRPHTPPPPLPHPLLQLATTMTISVETPKTFRRSRKLTRVMRDELGGGGRFVVG